jgi:hypothetical protein
MSFFLFPLSVFRVLDRQSERTDISVEGAAWVDVGFTCPSVHKASEESPLPEVGQSEMSGGRVGCSKATTKDQKFSVCVQCLDLNKLICCIFCDLLHFAEVLWQNIETISLLCNECVQLGA